MATEAQKSAARIAAKWWADRLRHGSKIDIGDSSMEVQIAGILEQAKAEKGRTPEMIDQFEELLAEFIANQFDLPANKKQSYPPDAVELYTDYGPHGDLQDVIDAAGIGSGGFPMKTAMAVYRDGRIMLRYGDGAKLQELHDES